MREARWSSRKRLSSRRGSSSSRSRSSIRPSCWLISVVLRRERVANISPTCPRSSASPEASVIAWRCISSKARASCPISSSVVTSIGRDLARVLAGADPRHRLGQLLLGDLERTVAHPPDRAQQGAGDHQREKHGDQEAQAGDHGTCDCSESCLPGRRGQVAVDVGEQVGGEAVVRLVGLGAAHVDAAGADLAEPLGVALVQRHHAVVVEAEGGPEAVDRGAFDTDLGRQVDRVGWRSPCRRRPGTAASTARAGRRAPGRAPGAWARAAPAR